MIAAGQGGSGGPCDPGGHLVRMISLDDMHSENIWFPWSKPSNYRGKLRCHACDGRTDGRTDGKWKIGQCSVGPETAKIPEISVLIINISRYESSTLILHSYTL